MPMNGFIKFFGLLGLSGLAMAVCIQAQTTPAASKVVALSGPDAASAEIFKRVILPAGLREQRYVGIPIPVAEYGNYWAIIFAERDEKALNTEEGSWLIAQNLSSVQRYLESGGIVIFCHYGITNVFPKRSLGSAAALVGFKSFLDFENPSEISLN